MNQFEYLLKCIRHLDAGRMFRTVKKISQKAEKPYLLTLADVIWCGLRYQAGYNDYQEFEFYRMNRGQRRTYLTRGINNCIIRKYNDPGLFPLFDDKGRFYRKYDPFLHRTWLDLRSCSEEDFASFARERDSFMVKPADGEGGRGVERVSLPSDTDWRQLYARLLENGQNIVEETVRQHEEMNRLYDRSVNTLRMFTFFDGKEAHLLQSILKIGNGSVVDNFSSGGMYTFLDQNGRVRFPAIDKFDNLFEKHPISGMTIPGFTIPLAEEAKALVLQAAAVEPKMGYVGWDVAIAPDGPLIIEGNAYPGVFQPRASFSETGEGILSVYRKYMDI